MSANDDRIAQLTAELDKTRQAAFNAGLRESNALAKLDAEIAAHERTKAEIAEQRRNLWLNHGCSTSASYGDVLANLGCDDGTGRPDDIAETKRLLDMPIKYTPPAGRELAERVRQLEVVAAKARVAVGKTYRAGADDELRDVLAALDAKGTSDV